MAPQAQDLLPNDEDEGDALGETEQPQEEEVREVPVPEEVGDEETEYVSVEFDGMD